MKTKAITKEKVLSNVIPISAFVLLMALASRVVIPLPFSPVPITLQVLFVILSGLVLGSKRAATVQISYLTLILMGVPLTAYGLSGPIAFASPTAGYLLAFVPATYFVGLYSEKFKGNFHFLLAGIIGIVVIYLGGTAWLSMYLRDFSQALKLGVAPFILVDILKAVVAVILAKGLQGFWKTK